MRINHQFTLKISGNSDGPRQAVQVWSQKASTRCASNSSLENARTYSSTRLRRYVNPGPFLFTQHVTARVLGSRRICAYLDNGPRTAPQLTAGATYTVKLPKCTRIRRHNCSRT